MPSARKLYAFLCPFNSFIFTGATSYYYRTRSVCIKSSELESEYWFVRRWWIKLYLKKKVCSFTFYSSNVLLNLNLTTFLFVLTFFICLFSFRCRSTKTKKIATTKTIRNRYVWVQHFYLLFEQCSMTMSTSLDVVVIIKNKRNAKRI